MKSKTKDLCDLCKKEVIQRNIYNPELEQIHGIEIIFGYSRGGWGYRCDNTLFTGEVCETCFNTLKTKYDEIEIILNKLKNSSEVKKPKPKHPLYMSYLYIAKWINCR